MLNWWRKWWPGLAVVAVTLILFDAVFSSLLTCHPVGSEANQTINNQHADQCSALGGPLLLSLEWLVDFLDKHGEAAVAAFTAVLTIFTGRLWFSTEKLWSVTNQSVELARNEFLSSHRPKMRLKHMWLTENFAWRTDGPLEVNLDIVNIGNTEGLVTWINYISILLHPSESLPQRPPYDEMPFGPDMRITRFRTFTPVGAGITLARAVCDGTILSQQQVHDVLWGDQRLFLVGTIEYVDHGGGLRQTGFCRRLTFNAYPPLTLGDLGRFETQDDPDYEFEEWD